jgi:hypothetical protein
MLYKDYLVVSDASFHDRVGRWAVFAYVIRLKDHQLVKDLQEPPHFATRQDAEDYGVKRCCQWVDGQVLKSTSAEH